MAKTTSVAAHDSLNTKIPKHIAIIMDGNGRWAKKRHLPRVMGHHEGFKTVERIVEACSQRKIEVLTLFTFSTENWQRPLEEIKFLLSLFLKAFKHEVKKLHQNNVQLHVVGDLKSFNQELQESIAQAMALTANNTGLKLVIAAGFGGRWDIVQATNAIGKLIQKGELLPEQITPEIFAAHLSLAKFPDPDLLIRTSGEYRISNFLLWNLAYTELFFTDILWPDFNATILDEAIEFYQSRQRRFGFTGEQIEQCKSA